MTKDSIARILGLWKAFQATRDQHATALGVPGSAPVVLSYLGMLTLINLYGVVQLGPLAGTIQARKILDLAFYEFWHGSAESGYSMLTAVMVCNSLMTIYLWLCFRAEGRRELTKRLFFLSSGVVLLTLLHLYWRVATQEPPSLHVLAFPG
ncbi:MAG: hypothetical protein AAFY88_04455 [Acidobacteriota bacterium]